MREHDKVANKRNSKKEIDGTTVELDGFNILVAETDFKTAKIVVEHIRLNQGQASSVFSFDELTQQIILNNYDVIFLGESFVESSSDVHSTRITAAKLASLVRRIKVVSKNTKVIVLASHGEELLAVDLLKAGIDDYLSLKGSKEKLVNAVSASLQYLKDRDLVVRQHHLPNQLNKQLTSQHMHHSESSREKQQVLHWVKNLPGCVLIVDEEFNIISANNNCEKMLGYAKRSLIGAPLKKLLPDKLYLELVNTICQPDKGGKIRIGELVIDSIVIDARTEGIPVQCIVKPLRLSAVNGYTFSMQDISWSLDQKATQIMQYRWQQLMSEFAQKFITLPVKDFSTLIKSFLKKSAVMLASERVYMYRLDKTGRHAYLSFEWLEGQHSLKIFSKEITVSERSPELQRLLGGESLLLAPLDIIKKTQLSQPLGLSEHLAQVNSESSYVVPLKNKTQVYGWIGFDIQRKGRTWQQNEMFNISELGQVINRAILRKKYEDMRHLTHLKLIETHGKLSEQACLDSLTQIANRRYFDQIVKTEIGRAARDKSFISLVLCDIDFFKEYNDEYGHLAGDQCLQRVARNFETSFKRAADFVARYGGEEFVIILPGLDCRGAYEAAEKMRNNLFQLNIPHRGSAIGRVTISVGLTCIESPPIDCINEMIERADKALYRAKSKGKNRVFIYEQRRNPIRRSLSL